MRALLAVCLMGLLALPAVTAEPVAVGVEEDADGDVLALSVFGDATTGGTGVAASGTGDAGARRQEPGRGLGASGTGRAHGNTASVSGLGDAAAADAAATGTGDAQSRLAVSGLGDAAGDAALSGLGNASARAAPSTPPTGRPVYLLAAGALPTEAHLQGGGAARNDGADDMELRREGGSEARAGVGRDGAYLAFDAEGAARGAEAYGGFLAGGLEGTAGLHGTLTLSQAECGWQTWGSAVAVGDTSAPRAQCALHLVTP